MTKVILILISIIILLTTIFTFIIKLTQDSKNPQTEQDKKENEKLRAKIAEERKIMDKESEAMSSKFDITSKWVNI